MSTEVTGINSVPRVKRAKLDNNQGSSSTEENSTGSFKVSSSSSREAAESNNMASNFRPYTTSGKPSITTQSLRNHSAPTNLRTNAHGSVDKTNLYITSSQPASRRSEPLPGTVNINSPNQHMNIPSLPQRSTRSGNVECKVHAGGESIPPHQGQQHSGDLALKKPTVSYRLVLARRGLLVKETLGAGSYSKVKHAICIPREGTTTKLYPDEVAVKIIDRAIAPKDFQQKFLPRELQLWPHINHPNIVKMLSCFAESQKVYMVLEYVEAGDALKFIQNSGAVSENTGRIWVKQVADAVRYLHDMNITHRDLKLENMLIDKNNNIKICDFGFVKHCSDTDLSRTFCGSKSYAAPEILKGEPYAPKKADIWAIGVILFILVTGRMPFDETKGNASLLEEHKKLDLQWPRGRRSVSSQCKAVSLFCLKFQWTERPSIHQVLSHSWFKISGGAANK